MYKAYGTIQTSTGPVTVTADVDYDFPRQGDSLIIFGRTVLLGYDMQLRAVPSFNQQTRKYEAVPMRTGDGTNRLVFEAHGYTWRTGEPFNKFHG